MQCKTKNPWRRWSYGFCAAADPGRLRFFHKIGDGVVNGLGRGLHHFLVMGELAQRGGNIDLNWHKLFGGGQGFVTVQQRIKLTQARAYFTSASSVFLYRVEGLEAIASYTQHGGIIGGDGAAGN